MEGSCILDFLRFGGIRRLIGSGCEPMYMVMKIPSDVTESRGWARHGQIFVTSAIYAMSHTYYTGRDRVLGDRAKVIQVWVVRYSRFDFDHYAKHWIESRRSRACCQSCNVCCVVCITPDLLSGSVRP